MEQKIAEAKALLNRTPLADWALYCTRLQNLRALTGAK